jgi:hypothetical protein
MASFIDFLGPLTEPFTPYLRDRLERALPDGARLGSLAIDGTSVVLEDLVFEGQGFRATVTKARAKLAARGLVRSDAAEATLEFLEGAIELTATETIAATTLDLFFFPSGRGTHWVDGRLELRARDSSLHASGELEIGRGGVFLSRARVTASKTSLEGSIQSRASLDSYRSPKLEGMLEGTLTPSDLPILGSPIDLRDVRLKTSIRLSGTRARPEIELDARGAEVPVRAPSQKRFLPHLRLPTLEARARFSGGDLSADLTLATEGGGRLAVRASRGAKGEARTRIQVGIERVAEGTMRHLFALFGVTGLRWELGEIDGELTLTETSGSLPGELGATGELRATKVDVGLGKAIFPLERPKLAIAGSTRTPELHLTAQVDGGTFELTYGPSAEHPNHPLVLGLVGAGPRVLARLSQADPTMTPFVVEGDAHAEKDLVLPSSFRIGLTARPSPSALSADVTLEADDTRIELRLRTEHGQHGDSRLFGTLSPRHARVLFSLAERAPGLGVGGRPIAFDLALAGTAEKPSLVGRLSTERLELRGLGRALTLEGVDARVHVAPTFVAFERASANVGHGRVSASGVVRTSPGEKTGHLGRIHAVVEDVRIGRQELFPEGAPIDGRLFAHAVLTISRPSTEFPRGTTRTEVFAKLAEPSYDFLPNATARLVRLGLPSVPTGGDAPLEAHMVLEEGLVRIHEARASVPGLRLEGRVELRPEAQRLSADARVTVERAWLSRSRVLALPGALLGTVTVPIAVRGSFDRPETKSELAKAIVSSLTRGVLEPRGREATSSAKSRTGTLDVQTSPFRVGSEHAESVRSLAEGSIPLVEAEVLLAAFLSRDPD